jgi:hypothetical protein
MRFQAIPITLMILTASLTARAQTPGKPAEMAISSPTDRIQLMLGGKVKDPESQRTYDIDLTRKARITVENPAIAKADDTAGVMGLADGRTRVILESGDRRQIYDLVVRGVSKPAEPNFEIDVQPILTRLGCNSGPCHGKARGQNGFQLSLFGFDPAFDYHSISKKAQPGCRTVAANGSTRQAPIIRHSCDGLKPGCHMHRTMPHDPLWLQSSPVTLF